MNIYPLGSHWQWWYLIFIWLGGRDKEWPACPLGRSEGCAGILSPKRFWVERRTDCEEFCWHLLGNKMLGLALSNGTGRVLRSSLDQSWCLPVLWEHCLVPLWDLPTKGQGQSSAMPAFINPRLQLNSHWAAESINFPPKFSRNTENPTGYFWLTDPQSQK